MPPLNGYLSISKLGSYSVVKAAKSENAPIVIEVMELDCRKLLGSIIILGIQVLYNR